MPDAHGFMTLPERLRQMGRCHESAECPGESPLDMGCREHRGGGSESTGLNLPCIASRAREHHW